MKERPNVVFIYADDLGRGMLSCYGQKHFSTPNIDRIFEEGMNFTNAHGCHICAPARASILTGVHDSHCGRWQFTRAGIYKDYARGILSLEQVYELIHKTGIVSRAGSVFLPTVFKQAGYITGQIGKLEWGFATTGDEIKSHGWDYHYGYYDHEMCHGYYPPFVFEDGRTVYIPGNTDPDCGASQYSKDTFLKNGEDREMGRCVYSQDLFDEKIQEFLEKHKKEPFFLFHPSQLPHGALSIPDIHPSVKDNENLTLSEKVFASMVLRLDQTVGLILRKLEGLKLTDQTMVVFASDNGHSCYYQRERTGKRENQTVSGETVDHLSVRFTSESCGDIFDGNNGMTGCKSTNFEGGTRVPLMIKWPQHIAPHSETKCLVANYDFISTIADLLGVSQGEGKDGISYLNLLLGREDLFEEHEYVIFASARGPAIITKDGWKLRNYITDEYKFSQFGAFWDEIEGQVIFELYKVDEDYKEEFDLSHKYPEKAKELRCILMRECDGNVIHGTTQPHFVFYGYDYRKEQAEIYFLEGSTS